MFTNITFDLNKLLYTLWGQIVIIGGLLSIPSYLTVLLRYRRRIITLKLNKRQNIKKDVVPLNYLLFGLLTITIFVMIYVSQLF
jgi:hypothetical protein